MIRKLLIRLVFSILIVNCFSCTSNLDSDSSDCVLDENPFTYVEKMPAYLGRFEAIDSFVKANLIYPETARRNGIEGKVTIQFVIDKQGNLICPKIHTSLNEDCDKEVLRIFYLFPKWEPGTHNNKPVFISYALQVEFKL